MNENVILELLRTKGNSLFHRESQELEFKEQFNFAGLADYFRDFAAFANNRGGYLIFGVKDSPRILSGLTRESLNQFEKIDPEKITGYLIDFFSPSIDWEQAVVTIGNMSFGIFRIFEAATKPVIAKKSDDRDTIRSGEIYFRYGGRSQKILYPELEAIINKRIARTNSQWVQLMHKIGKVGPSNAAILDTEEGIIEKDPNNILVIDEELIEKIKFIKEGSFVEKDGTSTLRLIGDVVPVTQVEITKKIKEHTLKQYPLSATELAHAVCEIVPNIGSQEVWTAIKENGIKFNPDYSIFNFRNKKSEDEYLENGTIPAATPSIYNHKALEYIVNILKEN